MSVECGTTVKAEAVVEKVGKYDSKFIRYSGEVSALNGVVYFIGWTAPREDSATRFGAAAMFH